MRRSQNLSVQVLEVLDKSGRQCVFSLESQSVFFDSLIEQANDTEEISEAQKV